MTAPVAGALVTQRYYVAESSWERFPWCVCDREHGAIARTESEILARSIAASLNAAEPAQTRKPNCPDCRDTGAPRDPDGPHVICQSCGGKYIA